MPKAARSSLLKLVIADSSDDEFASSQADIRPINPSKLTAGKGAKDDMAAAKKGAARATATKKTTAAANKITKPAPKKTASAGRRRSGKLASAIEDAEELQEGMEGKLVNRKVPAKARGRKPAAAKEIEVDPEEGEDSIVVTPQPAAKKGRGRPKKAGEDTSEIAETQQTPRKAAPARRGRKPKAAIAEVVEIPETQPPQEEEDVEMAELEDSTVIHAADEEERVVPGAFPAEGVPASVARHTRQVVKEAVPRRGRPKATRVEPEVDAEESEFRPHHQLAGTKRPAAFGDDETISDDARRSQILSLEERYANLKNRHQDLREIAVRDAERNFDRLRTQTEEKAAVAERLIASVKFELTTLKAELAMQKKQVTQTISEKTKLEASYKSELDRSTTENNRLRTQVSDLTKSLAEVTKSLSDAKAESKNLVTKLAAARTAEAAKVVPGSAMKPGLANRQQNADALHAARQMQLKEDMYADLTALIVRAVKKEGDDDVFDCLQTGPNGSKFYPPTPCYRALSILTEPPALHFKLAVTNDDPAKDYDAAQYIYTPQLDPSRDRALIELLPDFLTTEIAFPRAQLAKFYIRVVRALNTDPAPADGSDSEEDVSEEITVA
jgi:hypothetical protein